jgi:Mn2+/Fe2+ NRAMP family transporter
MNLINRRKSLFLASIVAALLSAVAVFIDWTVPFPLVAHSDGSLSVNPWDDRVLWIGFALCLTTVALAAFGRGRWRWLLIAAGLLLFVFSLIGYLQNHV